MGAVVLELTCGGTPRKGGSTPVNYSRSLAARFREAESGEPFGEAGSTTMARCSDLDWKVRLDTKKMALSPV
jgi:hypothetical protein